MSTSLVEPTNSNEAHESPTLLETPRQGDERQSIQSSQSINKPVAANADVAFTGSTAPGSIPSSHPSDKPQAVEPLFLSTDPDSPFLNQEPSSPTTRQKVVEPSPAYSAPPMQSSPASQILEIPPQPQEAPPAVPVATANASAAKETVQDKAISTPPTSQAIAFKASKKGGTVKNWKSRYWVFEPTGGILSYYADKEHKSRKGFIELRTCTGIGPIRHDRVSHTLGLQTKDRLWVLAFESADEMGRIQTSLSSVVQGFLETQDVPVSALGKLKRGIDGLTKKSSKSPSKTDATAPTPSSSGNGSFASDDSNNRSSSPNIVISHDDASSSKPTTTGPNAAHANEKAAIPKLNQNLGRIREYTGKEFTLECDMGIVRARLESDHPDRKDHPGDIIYDGFMGALASKFQELCEWSMYRDVINHKCSGRIAIRISDEDKDKDYKCPFMKLDQGTLVIVCHRSLLTANLLNLGNDILDVLSVDEPMHICAIKDIEDHKQGIKACLVRIQGALSTTYQFECDYTEGFKALQTHNPQVAKQCRLSWGEVIYKVLESLTAHIVKISSDVTAKSSLLASTPNKAIRITVVPDDPSGANRASWTSTDHGTFHVLLSAANFNPDQALHW